MKNNDSELQISEFIKDPPSLKLLILAGTNVLSTQLSTVARCTGLIKLDLSLNGLTEVPLKFHIFVNLKILYLHDNELSSVSILKTSLQYVSLFNNPLLSGYRSSLIEGNEHLLAIDCNIITKRQKLLKVQPKSYTSFKWPLVEIASNLDHEEDYLNLLKAQIFVVSNLHRKAIALETVAHHMLAFNQYVRFETGTLRNNQQEQIQQAMALESLSQWKQYTKRSTKLRQFLQQRGKQHLVYNDIDQRRYKRSSEVNEVLIRFIANVRLKIEARKVLQRHVRAYRCVVPMQQQLLTLYHGVQSGTFKTSLYFKESQVHLLSKVFLFTKKLLFQNKQYDLCDHFDSLIKQSGRKYLLVRQPKPIDNQRSFLADSIHQTMRMVIIDKGVDRQHLLYTRKGHKHIKVKPTNQFNKPITEQQLRKSVQLSKKINSVYDRYETLIQYSITDQHIFKLVMRLLRFFNSGNSSAITSTKAAYFQTQVVFDEEEDKRSEKIYTGIQFFVERVIAANRIQRAWRKCMDKKRSRVKLILEMRIQRASNLIEHWLSNLIFTHRMILNKMNSFLGSIWKDKELFLHLDVYMKLPIPTDFLRLKENSEVFPTLQDMYSNLHFNTETQIFEAVGRKWIRIKFTTPKQAFKSYKELLASTYRYYYNGFFIKLFTFSELQKTAELKVYENKIRKIFKIKIEVSEDETHTTRKIPIQNPNPFFVWFEAPQEENKIGKREFPDYESKRLPINMFIYNKNRRPLKVNCELVWVCPYSIYKNKKQRTTVRVRTPTKMVEPKYQFIVDQLERNKRKRSLHKPEIQCHKSLLTSPRRRVSQHLQTDLLSQTLNIRRK